MTKYEQRRLDFIGRRFGRLVVREDRGTRHGQVEYLCECDCGAFFLATKNHIGVCTNSCGCIKREVSRARMLKHGLSKTVEFKTWNWMKTRCENPGVKCFHRYGGRGVRVCERWRNSFEAFYEDMGPRPSPEHSLDRYPNNNGNYEPGNCRWATREEQGANQRNNVLIAYGEVVLTATIWARLLGARAETLRYRKHKGWADQSIIETPIRGMEAGWRGRIEAALSKRIDEKRRQEQG